jgi:hypothetical protein
MDEEVYRDALTVAREELYELLRQRAEIDGRITKLRETVDGLAYLLNEEDGSQSMEMGLTSAVAKVLRVTGEALTPSAIRNELAMMGYNVKKYKEIIPSIHKVLQRLHEKGFVDIGTQVTKDGKKRSGRKVYIWSPIQPNIAKDYMHNTYGWVVDEVANQKGVIDPFAGQAIVATQRGIDTMKLIAAAEKPKIIYTDPPYAATKKKGNPAREKSSIDKMVERQREEIEKKKKK